MPTSYSPSLILLFILLICGRIRAQEPQVFPVKKDGKWGFMDQEGRLVLDPRFDALSPAANFGYFRVQIGNRQGILDGRGKSLIPVSFDRVRILDSLIFAVESDRGWTVIDQKLEVLRSQYFADVQALQDGFFRVKTENGWGVLDEAGRMACPALFSSVQVLKAPFFQVAGDRGNGVVRFDGKKIIPAEYREILLLRDQLFLVKKKGNWLLFDADGRSVSERKFRDFEPLGDNFLRLFDYAGAHLYSMPCKRIIAREDGQRFLPLTQDYLLTVQRASMGVIDLCGQSVLPAHYEEIQWFGNGLFRVRRQGRWTVVGARGKVFSQRAYDYIAPLQGRFAKMVREEKFGLLNTGGEEVLAPVFKKIEIAGRVVKAYREAADPLAPLTMELFQFDERGALLGDARLQNHFTIQVGRRAGSGRSEDRQKAQYVLDRFEWFYDSQTGRWGLRDIQNGVAKIEPTFEQVLVYPDLGITLVGLSAAANLELERTSFRMNHLFGIVQNDSGLLMGKMAFRHVFIEDFRAGHGLARCILEDGRFGLVSLQGQIRPERYAYIGPFRDGLARVALSGRLSASLQAKYPLQSLRSFLHSWQSGYVLMDNTRYDHLLLDRGSVFCENGVWSFLDTTGHVFGGHTFQFASNMVNGVAMINQGGKWGLYGKNGRIVLPCAYDEIRFLEETNNTIVQLYVRKPRYGLIDTLGKLAINAVYDEVGPVSAGRLAVMKDGQWGFANREGQLVIPCRYEEVRAFQEDLAAVKYHGKWGYIDPAGKVIIPFQYQKSGDFSHGRAWVYLSPGGYGYIDRQGREVIAADYDWAGPYTFGVAIVREAGKYGLIDPEGRTIVEPRFYDIQPFSPNGLARVQVKKAGHAYGLINARGELVGSRLFGQIGPFAEGLAPVESNGKFGYVDVRGDLVIKPRFDRAASFSEGRAAVYLEQGCSYIDPSGSVLTDFEYTDCQDFKDGRAVVFKGLRKAGLLDTEGHLVLEPSIDRLVEFTEGRGLVRDPRYRFYFITEEANPYRRYYDAAKAYQNGVAVVKVDEKWGIINRKGITLIRPKYSRIGTFENGYAKVEIEGYRGLSNLEGDLIVKPGFEHISYVGAGLFRIEQGDQIGYCDRQGEWVWELTR